MIVILIFLGINWFSVFPKDFFSLLYNYAMYQSHTNEPFIYLHDQPLG